MAADTDNDHEAVLVPSADEDGSIIQRASDDFLQTLIHHLDHRQVKKIKDLLHPLHVADVADVVEALPPHHRTHLIAVLKVWFDPEILIHLEEPILEHVVTLLGVKHIAKALQELDSDDALAILEGLPLPLQHKILAIIPPRPRAAIEESLAFPEDCAGRLMQQEVVTASPYWTVKHTIDYLRRHKNLPSEFFDVYVVNTKDQFLGSIPTGKLLTAKSTDELIQLLEEDPQVIPVATPKKEVASYFHHYGLLVAPVVNDDQVLLGIITADDVFEVLEEATEREVLHIAGMSESDFFSPWFETFYRRLGWLIVGFINSLISVLVIAQFTDSLKEMVALAILMPIISTMSANAGIQVISVAVRALSMHALKKTNSGRAMAKEALVGSLNGVLFGAALIVLSMSYFDSLPLGIVLAVSMILTMLWAAFAGVLLPILLDRMNFDPAIGSGPLLSATTDVIGYVLFLGLATLFLL